MITGFGIGEILIIGLMLLLSFDPKKVGRMLRQLKNFKEKFVKIQSDIKDQVNHLIEEDEDQEQLRLNIDSKDGMREWGNKRVHHLTSADKFEASKKIMERLEAMEPFKEAKIIGSYYSRFDELDTSLIHKKLQESGKTLALPWVDGEKMDFCRIDDLHGETAPGAFGILEPVQSVRESNLIAPDLILVPGRCFDARGGRIGRGKGYYDRYLENSKATKIGLCFDVQISHQDLNIESFDVLMDVVISDKQTLDPGAKSPGPEGKLEKPKEENES